MQELLCKYLFVEKGMKLYSDPAMAPIANRHRRDRHRGQILFLTTEDK